MSGIGLVFLRRGGQAHPTAGSDYILSATKGDPEVFRILMEKGVSSDGVGITREDAARVTDIGTWFKGNTLIKTFDEFKYFVGVTRIGRQEWASTNASFNGCSNLQLITLPPSLKQINYAVFNGCSNLEFVNFNDVDTIFHSAFIDCAKLNVEVIAPYLKGDLGAASFRKTAITRVLDLGEITSISKGSGWSDGTFQGCTNLDVMIIPASVKSIGMMGLAATSLKVCVMKGATPPSIGQQVFPNLGTSKGFVYVPDEAVEAYKAATNWSSVASYIKGVSHLPTDAPTIYEEISNYL